MTIHTDIKNHFLNTHNLSASALDISNTFSITRETASRHLNKLCKEEFLIKNTKKPRFFKLQDPLTISLTKTLKKDPDKEIIDEDYPDSGYKEHIPDIPDIHDIPDTILTGKKQYGLTSLGDPKTYSSEHVSELLAGFDKEREEKQEIIDSLNFKITTHLQDISTIQDIIKKQNFQIENHSIELLEKETTIENLIDIKLLSVNHFMIKLKQSNSFAAKHLKEKLAVKGKHRHINKERVIRIIRDTIDITNDIFQERTK